jgi:hypothetical protein
LPKVQTAHQSPLSRERMGSDYTVTAQLARDFDVHQPNGRSCGASANVRR